VFPTSLAPQTHGWRSSKKIQAAVTIAHGGLLFPPEIPQNSANIDLPAKPPSLFPKSSCSLCSSNYKGIRSAEFHSFSRFSRPECDLAKDWRVLRSKFTFLEPPADANFLR
jgi:hypothetical protein